MDLFGHLGQGESVNYQSIVAKGQLYIDKDFGSSLKSIENENSKVQAQMLNQWKKVVWKRATDLFGGTDLKVFSETIEPNDII